MTTNQMLHHDEQMAACRMDYERLWRDMLQPRMHALNYFPDLRVNLTIHDLCWQAFKEGKRGNVCPT